MANGHSKDRNVKDVPLTPEECKSALNQGDGGALTAQGVARSINGGRDSKLPDKWSSVESGTVESMLDSLSQDPASGVMKMDGKPPKYYLRDEVPADKNEGELLRHGQGSAGTCTLPTNDPGPQPAKSSGSTGPDDEPIVSLPGASGGTEKAPPKKSPPKKRQAKPPAVSTDAAAKAAPPVTIPQPPAKTLGPLGKKLDDLQKHPDFPAGFTKHAVDEIAAMQAGDIDRCIEDAGLILRTVEKLRGQPDHPIFVEKKSGTAISAPKSLPAATHVSVPKPNETSAVEPPTLAQSRHPIRVSRSVMVNIALAVVATLFGGMWLRTWIESSRGSANTQSQQEPPILKKEELVEKKAQSPVSEVSTITTKTDEGTERLKALLKKKGTK